VRCDRRPRRSPGCAAAGAHVVGRARASPTAPSSCSEPGAGRRGVEFGGYWELLSLCRFILIARPGGRHLRISRQLERARFPRCAAACGRAAGVRNLMVVRPDADGVFLVWPARIGRARVLPDQ